MNNVVSIKRSVIYEITIDGKTVTVIDTNQCNYHEFVKHLYIRFGQSRIGKIVKK